VRSGTSSNTYTDNSVGHSFTAAEYNTAGTWTYYRQVRDNTCATTTWQQSSGSYELTVITCPYTGSDLYIDATHLCQQRTSGARNWEAWIKDTRDNELYRIVIMPDNKWWLAQNVKYANTGSDISGNGCTPELCGRWYTSAQSNSQQGGTSGYGANIQGVCPNGWVLPVYADWTTFISSISADNSVVATRVRALQSQCTDGNDYYGWASGIAILHSDTPFNRGSAWNTNDNSGTWGIIIDHVLGSYAANCGKIARGSGRVCCYVPTRCFRQL
jgi:uncharacterized protein (TIGR02145 family)